jgi:putative membrane protein
MYTLLHLAMLTGTVLLLARFLPGVRIKSTSTAIVVAVVFSLLNFFIGWLIKAVLGVALFLPAILTLGLAWLAIPFLANTALLWLTDKALDAFELRDGRTLLLGATAITLANFLFHLILAR